MLDYKSEKKKKAKRDNMERRQMVMQKEHRAGFTCRQDMAGISKS